MYKCPICKHSRTSKLHTDKCSKIAKETLEPTPTTETKPSAYVSIYDHKPFNSRFK
jgi:hypothetical protein